MVRGAVTLVVYLEDGASPTEVALREIADRDTAIVEASAEEIGPALIAARDRGAVVAIAPAERLPSLLELGADEVVVSSTSVAELHEVMTRARARAHWRTSNRDIESPELGGLALMSAAIGHEMRNSLASALLNCSTLETMLGRNPTDPEIPETISDINEALKSMADVVNQMVSLTSLSDTAAACDLGNALVELTTYLHKEVVRVADFEAQIPSEPCSVGLSRARALEVVASVLNNAVLAVETVTSRRPRVELRLTQEAEMVVVEVTDNGVGMTPEVRKQAVNPFFTTRRPGSLGLGLTFAATTVRRAGGEILIDSEVDEGTSVRLFLPRVPRPAPGSARLKN